MGVIYIRAKESNGPKRTRRRNPSPSPKTNSSQGMRIERNREGTLYVREPCGNDSLITWQVDDRGEVLLRKYGITEGQILPRTILSQLKSSGYLYTKRSKDKALDPAIANLPKISLNSKPAVSIKPRDYLPSGGSPKSVDTRLNNDWNTQQRENNMVTAAPLLNGKVQWTIGKEKSRRNEAQIRASEEPAK